MAKVKPIISIDGEIWHSWKSAANVCATQTTYFILKAYRHNGIFKMNERNVKVLNWLKVRNKEQADKYREAYNRAQINCYHRKKLANG